MRVQNHRLFDDAGQVPLHKSDNIGGALSPEYLVIHYTAGRSFDSSVSWLCNPAAKASAHIVIGRNGEIAQLAPFDRVTWHAGVSQWLGRSGANNFSIGIELDNGGKLDRVGSKWRAWFGDDYSDDEVLVACHRNGGPECGWHAFTPQQLESTIEVAAALVSHYGLRDILGHEDISPGRKTDPGPAFPMASLRARIMGRADDSADMVTATALNLRAGPGVQHAKVIDTPLPQGARLDIVGEQGEWRAVVVLDQQGPLGGLEGWVNGRFLRPARGRACSACRSRHSAGLISPASRSLPARAGGRPCRASPAPARLPESPCSRRSACSRR